MGRRVTSSDLGVKRIALTAEVRRPGREGNRSDHLSASTVGSMAQIDFFLSPFRTHAIWFIHIR